MSSYSRVTCTRIATFSWQPKDFFQGAGCIRGMSGGFPVEIVWAGGGLFGENYPVICPGEDARREFSGVVVNTRHTDRQLLTGCAVSSAEIKRSSYISPTLCYRVPTHPWKYLIFLLNSRPWKYLKTGHAGASKFLNFISQVLECPW